jgi:hypothetical protein
MPSSQTCRSYLQFTGCPEEYQVCSLHWLKFRQWQIGGPPLWSSGQSSWLQIQRSGSDSRRYQIFREIVDLERGPLSLVSGSGLENREYGRRDPSRWPRGTLYPQKLALTSPTSGDHSVGIIHSWTKATEFLDRRRNDCFATFLTFCWSGYKSRSGCTMSVVVRDHTSRCLDSVYNAYVQ